MSLNQLVWFESSSTGLVKPDLPGRGHSIMHLLLHHVAGLVGPLNVHLIPLTLIDAHHVTLPHHHGNDEADAKE